ncbi:NAD-dependent epimerase/dehydratase family protein [Longispora sp. NPDC051575]|uniref:NAD-dependent epimerase/dehydratase family protein n=1 Tax=Longispora sp. NPDC051575 TaxID=3154943 RepID=UPI0034208B1F
MRLLVLGGTWFLGRTLAESALLDGWEVTCFNRGRSGTDVAGVRSIRGDRTVAADVARLADAGPWDVVVDTSAFEPADVALVSRALRPVAERYVLISTVSAYQGWPNEPVSEASALWPSRADVRPTDPDVVALEERFQYGVLKVGCELAAEAAFGEDLLILRPGVVLGPYEYVGRLPALLRRAVSGGAVLAAGDPAQSIQPVDVRDLSAFILALARQGTAGAFSAVAPPAATYGGLHQACIDATGSDARVVFVDGEWLAGQGVREWTEVPLWRRPAGTWAVDHRRSLDAGLVCRPLAQTVAETWEWLQREAPVPHERAAEHGLDRRDEATLLAAWSASGR